MGWILVGGSLVATFGVMLGIRKSILDSLDDRIAAKAGGIVADQLRDPLAKLAEISQTLNNGIKSRVDANTQSLDDQDRKLDGLAAGQAEMKGQLVTLKDWLLERRVGGRRSTDPE